MSVPSIIHKHRNFILYGFIGLAGAAIDYILFVILVKVFGVPPTVASFISVSVGIVNNFLLNAKFNFRVSDKLLARFRSFYLIGVTGALLSSVLIFILHDWLAMDALVAKLITIPPVVLGQFIFNKMFSFRYTSKDESKAK